MSQVWKLARPAAKRQRPTVALFDRDATSKTIETVVQAQVDASDYCSLEAVCPTAPELVVELIHEAGGLAVLAHADSSKGVLSDMAGQPRNKVMNSDGLRQSN